MGQISRKLRAGESHLTYWCQGCRMAHSITHGGDGWKWNGDVERPTFEPSVLVTGGHYASNWKKGDRCWCTYNAEHPDDPSTFTCQRCHTFIREGMVQFLRDCSHELAGQTLPLPDLPEHLRDND